MTTETVWAHTPAELDDAIAVAVKAHHQLMPASIHFTCRAPSHPDAPALVCLLVWERD